MAIVVVVSSNRRRGGEDLKKLPEAQEEIRRP